MAKLFIGPYKTGLQKNLKPWLLNEEAFVNLFNAYVWRGRVKKKQGIRLIGRLHVASIKSLVPVPITNLVAGSVSYTSGAWAWALDLPISPGTVIIRIDVPVAGWGNIDFVDNGNGTLTVDTVPANLNYGYGTIDYNTGIFTITWQPGLPVVGPYLVTIEAFLRLPHYPVMGICNREQDVINAEESIVFDTSYSYYFNQGTQSFTDSTYYKTTAIDNHFAWTGTDADFFWTCNYYKVTNRSILWATNNIEGNHSYPITNIANGIGADAGFVVFTVGALHPFYVNDIVYLDEILGAASANGYNGLSASIRTATATTITLNIAFIAASNGAATGYAFDLSRTVSGDGLRYYDGYGANLGWRNFNPPLQTYPSTVANAVYNYLVGCLIVLPYKDRLLAFNTIESPAAGGSVRYQNRVRWSQNGTPFYTTATAPVAAGQPRAGTQWVSDTPGKGGYIDAPTSEAIVSVSLFKDTCLVFFERSTWQLRYTGSEILPFVWERINEQMGAESTFSPIYFDGGVFAIGDKGIIAANSYEVQRVDELIPDLVYQIHNAEEGISRVHGIRDFQRKICYWTYPDTQTTFPNRILSLNYDEKSYAIFDNSHTAFGFLQSSEEITWGSNVKWSEEVTWGSGRLQSYYPMVIAGNQTGFIHQFDTEQVTNDISLDLTTSIIIANSISNTAPAVVQVYNHNLATGQFVRIWNTTGFATFMVGEIQGTAVAGSTAFSGTLTNLGLFPGQLTIAIGANVFTDLGDGTMDGGAGGSIINYEMGSFTVYFAALGIDTDVTADYFFNELNYRIFKIEVLTGNTFTLLDTDLTAFAAYTGSGSIEVVDNFNIRTKTLNPFIKEDVEARINYINAYLTTDDMNFTLNTYGGDNFSQILDTSIVSNVDYEGWQSESTWNRIYPNVTAPFFQLEMTMSDIQMVNYDNINNEFELHALILDVNTGARLR